MNVKIYHNPRCGKSRDTLALIIEKGIDPEIIEYLRNPLTASELKTLAKELKLSISDMVRKKEKIFIELNLKEKTEAELIKAIASNPILLERPIVVTKKGAKICRPPELVEHLI